MTMRSASRRLPNCRVRLRKYGCARRIATVLMCWAQPKKARRRELSKYILRTKPTSSQHLLEYLRLIRTGTGCSLSPLAKGRRHTIPEHAGRIDRPRRSDQPRRPDHSDEGIRISPSGLGLRYAWRDREIEGCGDARQVHVSFRIQSDRKA